MDLDRFATHGLRLIGGVFVVVSALAITAPTMLAGGMEISLDTPSALAEIRAGYGGLFAGLAALFLMGAAHARHRSLALGVAALVLGIFASARVLSLVLDGTPNTVAFANQSAETIGFVLAFALWRRSARD